MTEAQFITLDPAHFHAALVHKEMHLGISPAVHVYAPLGPDLLAHLNRMLGFNTRAKNPTTWELEVHACTDFLPRMLFENSGNVVMLSGRNHKKIDYMLAAVAAGLHVLADKPWIIRLEDFPKLERLLELAKKNQRVIFDMMTERHEITTILQRELIHDSQVFGELQRDTTTPTIEMESAHALKKFVAGQPLRRPAWYFDVELQGEGLADVGTHLVDMVNWLLFPEQVIDYRKEIECQSARRFPTLLSREDFQTITGEAEFPASLQSSIQDGKLAYFCNNEVRYAVRGVPVHLVVLWNLEASPAGGDLHNARVHGTKASIDIRQTEATRGKPEIYVVPRAEIRLALQRRIDQLSARYSGLKVVEEGGEFRIEIPDVHRIGHEAHFAQVTAEFLKYLQNPAAIPAWELPNLLAKYHVTTTGVALGRKYQGANHEPP